MFLPISDECFRHIVCKQSKKMGSWGQFEHIGQFKLLTLKQFASPLASTSTPSRRVEDFREWIAIWIIVKRINVSNAGFQYIYLFSLP